MRARGGGGGAAAAAYDAARAGIVDRTSIIACMHACNKPIFWLRGGRRYGGITRRNGGGGIEQRTLARAG